MDAKSGPSESSDFGENGKILRKWRIWHKWQKIATPLGEWRFCQKWRIWYNWRKIAKGIPISRMWQIFKLDAKSCPFKLYN